MKSPSLTNIFDTAAFSGISLFMGGITGITALGTYGMFGEASQQLATHHPGMAAFAGLLALMCGGISLITAAGTAATVKTGYNRLTMG